MYTKFVKWLFTGALGIYILLFLWLFNRHFSPFGVWSAEIEAPKTRTRLMVGPTPQSRVEVDDVQSVWRLNEPPVYFEVNNPKKFDQARIRVRFAGDAPIIEAGVVKSQDPWTIERRVLYHRYLEELNWPRIKEEGLILWQREAKYKSVQEFFENPPDLQEVAVVDAPRFATQLLSYSVTQLPRRYDVSLRGSQNIYLYTAGEDIEVKFLFQDVNRHDGKDVVEVQLIHGGEIVTRARLEDDGIEWGIREGKPPRELKVRHAKPEPGVYRLVVQASDDMFIRRLETHQHKIVWKGQLYLGDEVGYGQPRGPRTIWSNGQEFALRTPHPESVQDVAFEYSEAESPSRRRFSLPLSEHNQQYQIQMPREVAGDVVAITTPKRDLLVNSDGFFSLSPDAFFLPEPVSYASDLDLNRLGVNFVLARYTFSKSQKNADFRTSAVLVNTFDVVSPSPLQFFVSATQGSNATFKVKELAVRLQKPRLTWRRIFSRIKDAL